MDGYLSKAESHVGRDLLKWDDSWTDSAPKSRSKHGWFFWRLWGRLGFMPLSWSLVVVGHPCRPIIPISASPYSWHCPPSVSLSLSLHMTFLWRHQVSDLGPTGIWEWPHLTCLHLQRRYFQLRSCSGGFSLPHQGYDFSISFWQTQFNSQQTAHSYKLQATHCLSVVVLHQSGFMGTQSHALVHTSLMSAFPLQKQMWAIVTETIWPTKPRTFTIWPFQKKLGDLWARDKLVVSL